MILFEIRINEMIDSLISTSPLHYKHTHLDKSSHLWIPNTWNHRIFSIQLEFLAIYIVHQARLLSSPSLLIGSLSLSLSLGSFSNRKMADISHSNGNGVHGKGFVLNGYRKSCWYEEEIEENLRWSFALIRYMQAAWHCWLYII